MTTKSSEVKLSSYIKFFICLGLKCAGFVFLNPKAINRVGTINDAIYRPTEFVYCLRISLLPADFFIAKLDMSLTLEKKFASAGN